VAYFEAVAAHGGAFLVRLTRSDDPGIRTAWVEGQRTTVPTRIRRSRFLAQHAGQRVDAEGLIWASLCAAVLTRFLAHAAQRVGQGTAMSTRRVAMGAHHILDALVAAVLLGVGLRATLRRGLAYLLANARRAHPARDRLTGRLRAGLTLAEPA